MTTEEKLKLAQTNMGKLAGSLLFVIQGLRKGSITAKPIMLMSDDLESYPVVSLESELWKVLGECGIKEKKSEPNEPKKKESKL